MEMPTWTERQFAGVRQQRLEHGDTAFVLFHDERDGWCVDKLLGAARVATTSFEDETEAREWIENEIRHKVEYENEFMQ